MKYLKKFNNNSEYQNFKISDKFILPNVSLIVDDKIVMFNPFDLSELDPELLEIAGTAIVYDVNTSKLRTIAGEAYNTTDYPQDIYEPVGVVIMPASHTEDGMARMMSTKLMGVKTQDDGSVIYGSYDASNASEYNEGYIEWTNSDKYNVDDLITYLNDNPLKNSIITTKMPICKNNPYEVTIKTEDDIAKPMCFYTNLSDSETFLSWGCEFEEDINNPGNGWYKNIYEPENLYKMPSPYLVDGTPNIAMRVDGTAMGITHGSVVSDIVNEYSNNSGERFNAFNAAKVYSTKGTYKGSWYVPSLLEITYIAAKMKEIYSTMNKLNPNFNNYFNISISGKDFYNEIMSSILADNENNFVGCTPLFIENRSSGILIPICPIFNTNYTTFFEANNYYINEANYLKEIHTHVWNEMKKNDPNCNGTLHFYENGYVKDYNNHNNYNISNEVFYPYIKALCINRINHDRPYLTINEHYAKVGVDNYDNPWLNLKTGLCENMAV